MSSIKQHIMPVAKHLNTIDEIYFALDNNMTPIDWSYVDEVLEYINGRNDCADFRLQAMIRILFDYPEQVPKIILTKFKETVINFKYWMDEPGDDNMCYWSENHQLLFAASEYLLGQLYPNEIFTNNRMSGTEHIQKAKERLLYWLEMRWQYGFVEFYSNVYYNEDIAPLINLIDYCEDKEIVHKATIIMDLMMYDYASQSYRGIFSTVSGRAYEKHRKGGQSNSSNQVTNHIFGFRENAPYPSLSYCFLARKNYTIPSMLVDIGMDTSRVVVKASNGLNLSELKTEGLLGTDTRSNMMQWAMESFINKETVRYALQYMRKHKLFANGFLSQMKILNNVIFQWLHLEPLISIVLNPQPNGSAIQRGNTYTYKTKNYSMYTAQSYHPKEYGDQEHVQGVNLDENISLFHTHPAMSDEERGSGNSPMYWVGYGHLPHAVQHENIQLAIYNTPNIKGFMEKSLLNFTHAYFPTEKLDEWVIEDNYAFGRILDTYVSFTTKNNLTFAKGKTDDIIQPGKKSYWITHVGDKTEYSSFQSFMFMIKSNTVIFDEKKMALKYKSKNNILELKFNKDFKLNNVVQNLEYDRFDSPYIKATRKDKTFTFKYNEKELFLDFENNIREIKNI